MLDKIKEKIYRKALRKSIQELTDPDELQILYEDIMVGMKGNVITIFNDCVIIYKLRNDGMEFDLRSADDDDVEMKLELDRITGNVNLVTKNFSIGIKNVIQINRTKKNFYITNKIMKNAGWEN